MTDYDPVLQSHLIEQEQREAKAHKHSTSISIDTDSNLLVTMKTAETGETRFFLNGIEVDSEPEGFEGALRFSRRDGRPVTLDIVEKIRSQLAQA